MQTHPPDVPANLPTALFQGDGDLSGQDMFKRGNENTLGVSSNQRGASVQCGGSSAAFA